MNGAMRLVLSSIFLIFCAVGPIYAQPQSKLALLIGNAKYPLLVKELKNPVNDTIAVEAALRSIGFATQILSDKPRAEIMGAIKRYAAELNRAGKDAIGFLYYSGHGAARPGYPDNYLIPTDVPTMSDRNVWEKAIELNEIKDALKKYAPFATFFLVIDACRDELSLDLKSTGESLKGFVEERDRQGIYIAFSTSFGHTAADWPDRMNGPYAEVLAEEIVRPGIDHLRLFFNVGTRVAALTDDKQEPVEISGLHRLVYFNGEPRPKEDAPQRPPKGEEAQKVWVLISRATDPEIFKKFIEAYAETELAEKARMRLAELDKRLTEPTNNTPPVDPLVTSTKSNWPSYRRGETIVIELKSPLRSGLSAYADFDLGSQTKRTNAQYDQQKSAYFMKQIIPQDTSTGSYKVAVYAEEVKTGRKERRDIPIEIGFTRTEWTATYLQPLPGRPATMIPKGGYAVAVSSDDRSKGEKALREFCTRYPDLNFALYDSVNLKYQIEIGYNLSRQDAETLFQFAKDRKIATPPRLLQYGWDSHAAYYCDCFQIERDNPATSSYPPNGCRVRRQDTNPQSEPTYSPYATDIYYGGRWWFWGSDQHWHQRP